MTVRWTENASFRNGRWPLRRLEQRWRQGTTEGDRCRVDRPFDRKLALAVFPLSITDAVSRHKNCGNVSFVRVVAGSSGLEDQRKGDASSRVTRELSFEKSRNGRALATRRRPPRENTRQRYGRLRPRLRLRRATQRGHDEDERSTVTTTRKTFQRLLLGRRQGR